MNPGRTLRLFWWISRAIILLAASSKIWAVATQWGDLSAIHPLFPFSTNREVALMAVGLEVAVVVGMFTRDSFVRTILPTGLFALFLIYRLGLVAIGQSYGCGCFGRLHQLLGLPASVSDHLAWAADVLIPLAGIFLLVKHLRVADAEVVELNQVTKTSTARRSSRIWKKSLILLLAVVFLIPPLQVLYVAFVNPHTTMPAMLYSLGSKGYGVELVWKDLDHVPQEFAGALVNYEDSRFCEHFGFDLANIGASLNYSAQTGRPPAGASTITQQCARSLFLWQGRSWVRKVAEAYYTFWMELLLSKRRIMELYVNVIEFAPGVFGAEAGAQHYFQTGITQATPHQMAALIAVMPNPKHLSPTNLPPLYMSRMISAERDINRIAGDIRLRGDHPVPCIN